MADSFDVDAMVARFQERAKAVRDRPLPPLEGTARREDIARAQLAYQDLPLGGDADELRTAGRDEARLVSALADRARSILAESGAAASAAQQERLASTLRAAAVDPTHGERLRRGTLTGEFSPAGFGFGDLGPV